MNWSKLSRAVLALLVGLAGGAGFALLGVPLPWMLGSLTAAALLAVAGVGWTLPHVVRDFVRPAIGVMAGSAFTLPVLLSMLSWWPVIPFLFAFFILITLLGWIFFTRACKLDNTTAVFASTPGGLGELTLLGAQLGGNMRVLVLVHSIRVVAAVFLLPFLVQVLAQPGGGPVGLPPPTVAGALSASDWALLIGCAGLGYWIGRPFKRIGGVMLAPLLLSVLVHGSGMTDVGPPAWLIVLVQVAIGSIAGSRFAGIGRREFQSTAVQGLAWTVIMLIVAMLVAVLVSAFVDIPLAALVLAFAPGGFAEMTIVAYAIGIEVAFVVTCHVLRIISVLLLAPLLAQWLPAPPHAPRAASGEPDECDRDP